MADVKLHDDGSVEVDDVKIIGQWHLSQIGAGHFEDSCVLSTDTMSLDALRAKLGEMYSHSKGQS